VEPAIGLPRQVGRQYRSGWDERKGYGPPPPVLWSDVRNPFESAAHSPHTLAGSSALFVCVALAMPQSACIVGQRAGHRGAPTRRSSTRKARIPCSPSSGFWQASFY
jgi:hypothetical protein